MICPWCNKHSDKFMIVMYITDSGTATEKVCPDCRTAWIRRLKKEVGG